ncbi:MAG: type II toxin-antitoxin system RelE/ParE family toxin [Chloroflexota bacterium]
MPRSTSEWTVLLYPPWERSGPVERILRGLNPEQGLVVEQKIMLLNEHGPVNLFKGHLKPVRGLPDKVFEMRAGDCRLFVMWAQRTVVLLHIEVKKTYKLTKKCMKTLRRRAPGVDTWLKGER